MHLKELFLTADGRAQLRDLMFGFDGRIARSQFWLAQLVAFIFWASTLALLLLISMAPYLSACFALAAGLLIAWKYRPGWMIWAAAYALLLLFFALLGMTSYVAIVLAFIVVILALSSSFAVISKRLHDLGWNGWWQLVFWAGLAIFTRIELFAGSSRVVLGLAGFGFVSLALLAGMVAILGCLRGTDGPNRFGPDPLVAPEASAAA